MNKSLCFQGTIETDGVGASIIKQNTTTNRKMTQPKTKHKESEDAARYIQNLTQEELNETKSKCVLMDPGRRDLLYCMKETSTAKNKQFMAYTNMTRTKVSRHYRILSKKTKPASVKSSKAKLAKTKSSSVKIEEYEMYIKTRASVEKLQESGDTFPQPDESTGIDMHATYLELMISQRHISERLDNVGKTKLLEIVAKMSKESNDQGCLKQQASQILEKLQVLPFRKMKFSVKLYYDQANLITPSFCPLCEGKLESFKTERNPRPYKRKTRPTVFRHRLQRYWAIRYTNSGCLEQLKPRLWNRDLAAVLNFKKILTSLREKGSCLKFVYSHKSRRILRQGYRQIVAKFWLQSLGHFIQNYL
ncbi:hypothetical protein RMATCC62417_00375 [Rhizopus microsporus]|nr:hypothetical protein RMATCC62417_00375 [Rhizopus microsporus]